MNYLYPNYPTVNVTNQPNFNNGGSFFYINGKEEAERWIVNPGDTVFLLDRKNMSLYIKTVERNGLVQPLEVYSLTAQAQETQAKNEYATKEDLLNVKNEIMAKIGNFEPQKEIDNEQIITNSNTDTK